MQVNHLPKTDLEILAVEAVNILAEKFPETYFVGGYVRDILLNRAIHDIDIATSATPEQVAQTLHPQFELNDEFKTFGVMRANMGLEITTFRVETYANSRYPKVAFIDSVEADSLRRDFTINGLYMDREGMILDFHNGLADLGAGLVKFIGDPETRLREDPLRLLRAIRFALQLNFLLDSATATAIEKNFSLAETIKPAALEEEIKKLAPEMQKQFQIIINSKVLDGSLVNSYNGVV
jgi:tRNA nucleotidyltransferase (CCA-adding enzyme)